MVHTYRSLVKDWQVSCFVLGTITLNGTDTTVKQLDRHVKTFSADSSAIFPSNAVCTIQSHCPENKPAVLPLFYWSRYQRLGASTVFFRNIVLCSFEKVGRLTPHPTPQLKSLVEAETFSTSAP